MIAHIASLIAGGRPAALVAATILAVTAGGVVAGISLSFPRFRHPDQEKTERDLVPLLRSASLRVSSDLGYTGPFPGISG